MVAQGHVPPAVWGHCSDRQCPQFWPPPLGHFLYFRDSKVPQRVRQPPHTILRKRKRRIWLCPVLHRVPVVAFLHYDSSPAIVRLDVACLYMLRPQPTVPRLPAVSWRCPAPHTSIFLLFTRSGLLGLQGHWTPAPPRLAPWKALPGFL